MPPVCWMKCQSRVSAVSQPAIPAGAVLASVSVSRTINSDFIVFCPMSEMSLEARQSWPLATGRLFQDATQHSKFEPFLFNATVSEDSLERGLASRWQVHIEWLQKIPA